MSSKSPESSLKLENIYLHNGKIKIGDFGFAAVYDEAEPPTQSLGTPIYMAPEVLSGTPYDTKCDVYSLGVVLYYLIEG